MHRSPTIALAVIVTAPFVAPRAEACSVRLLAPADIRFDVDGKTLPTNAVLFGSGIAGPLADDSSWWLLSDDDAPIALTMSQLGYDATRFVPTSPLSPSTTYTLKWSPDGNAPADTSSDDVVDDGGSVRAITVVFQTGTDDDTTAPAAPTATTETQTIWPSGPADACGSGEGGTWARFFVDDSDIDDVVLWRLRDDDGAVLATSFVRADGDPPFLGSIETDGGRRTYHLVAVDHAGNESAATPYEIDLGFEGSCAASGAGTPLALVLAVRRRRHGRR